MEEKRDFIARKTREGEEVLSARADPSLGGAWFDCAPRQGRGRRDDSGGGRGKKKWRVVSDEWRAASNESGRGRKSRFLPTGSGQAG